MENDDDEVLRQWVEEAAVPPTRSPWASSPLSPVASAVMGAKCGGHIRAPTATPPQSIRESRRSARCALGHDVERVRLPTASLTLDQKRTFPTAHHRRYKELHTYDEREEKR